MFEICRAVLGLFVTIGFHIADGSPYIEVRKVGENFRVPCENVVYPNCSSTTWIFASRKTSDSAVLVTRGVKKNSGRAKRLRLGSDCSLIVLYVKTEDAGRYTCRQYLTEGGRQYGEDASIHLAVDTSEYYSTLIHKLGENISLPCDNVVYPNCSSTTWMFNSTELVGLGVIKTDYGREEGLSLGSDCSLMVLNVTTEDAGVYKCRQYLTKGGNQYWEEAVVDLYVHSSLTTSLSTTSTPPVTVGAAVRGAIGSVLLCLLAVIIIVHKKRAKKEKPNYDTLALTTNIVSNTTGNQQTHLTNDEEDGCDDGPTYATINDHSQT